MVRMTSYCFSYIQWIRSKKTTGSAHTQGKGSHKKGSPSSIGDHLGEHLPNYAHYTDFKVKFKSQHSSLITKHWSLNKTELSIYGTKEPLDESEREELKSWLKAQHSEN